MGRFGAGDERTGVELAAKPALYLHFVMCRFFHFFI